MSHPDEGLIHAWLDGELDAAEAARVEALVTNDADWAAAAAEARGLIAASARIVGALDRVPANVIPKAAPARRAPRRWAWRAAAVLAVMVGSAVVLKRERPELPAPRTDIVAVPAPPVALERPRTDTPAAAAAPKVQPQPVPEQKMNILKKAPETKSALADAKPAEPARDKDVAGAERRAVNAPMAAAAPALQQNFATQKLTRLQPSCFEQREPLDTSAHIVIRLSAAALADSIRLERMALRGSDTLVAVNGTLTAVRVPCPQP
jgi:hypothetical protein